MAIEGIIFDIDGTLIDTNPSHIEAWVRAFADHGYRISAERIGQEVGKGGDQLVPSVIGDAADRRDGEQLREAQRRRYLEIAAGREFRVFPRVPELFRALSARGIRTALATSSNREHLHGTLRSAGTDLIALADELVTKDDAAESKPAPDLVLAAVRALHLPPERCAMVGDTPYDAEACRRAGVACLGVLSGGFDRQALLGAGAREVWADTGALLDDVDRALEIAAA
ncbi:MAG TPA: HAD family hydrolase [Gemmatimonadales bacterium]|nr:HAD family hydrolase [Gemmatimonadales bacterium]